MAKLGKSIKKKKINFLMLCTVETMMSKDRPLINQPVIYLPLKWNRRKKNTKRKT